MCVALHVILLYVLLMRVVLKVILFSIVVLNVILLGIHLQIAMFLCIFCMLSVLLLKVSLVCGPLMSVLSLRFVSPECHSV
jgi:hypothetical protein